MDELRYPYADDWFGRCLPLHRRMADPDAPMPERGDQWNDRKQVFFAGLYAGVALFGWNDAGSGFRGLLLRQHTCDDRGPHAIVDAYLRPKGHLAALAWWTWTRNVRVLDDYLQQSAHCDTGLRGCQFVDDSAAARFGIADDNDALHLCGHLNCVVGSLLTGAASAPETGLWTPSRPQPPVVASDRSRGRTVVAVERFEDWPQALHDLGTSIPKQGDWEAHVASRRDGWIGTFRRCRTCRRWFTGYAAIHALGHGA